MRRLDAARSPTSAGGPCDRLLRRLIAYQRDPDRATVMSRIAKGYSHAQLRRIAAYIAARNLRRDER